MGGVSGGRDQGNVSACVRAAHQTQGPEPPSLPPGRSREAVVPNPLVTKRGCVFSFRKDLETRLRLGHGTGKARLSHQNRHTGGRGGHYSSCPSRGPAWGLKRRRVSVRVTESTELESPAGDGRAGGDARRSVWTRRAQRLHRCERRVSKCIKAARQGCPLHASEATARCGELGGAHSPSPRTPGAGTPSLGLRTAPCLRCGPRFSRGLSRAGQSCAMSRGRGHFVPLWGLVLSQAVCPSPRPSRPPADLPALEEQALRTADAGLLSHLTSRPTRRKVRALP